MLLIGMSRKGIKQEVFWWSRKKGDFVEDNEQKENNKEVFVDQVKKNIVQDVNVDETLRNEKIESVIERNEKNDIDENGESVLERVEKNRSDKTGKPDKINIIALVLLCSWKLWYLFCSCSSWKIKVSCCFCHNLVALLLWMTRKNIYILLFFTSAIVFDTIELLFR